MDNNNIITFLACICFLFIFGRIFIVPLKKVLKIVLNSILGGVFIYIVNLIGASFNFHIGLNFFTTILIRNIRATRSCLFDCYKAIDRLNFLAITIREDYYIPNLTLPKLHLFTKYT